MIRVYLSSCGSRRVTLLFICRTGAHTESWGARLLRRCIPARSLEVGHIRIFGCLTYSHVPEEKRTKLEPTTEKGILVGYSETSRAYRIYLPAQRKIVLRRDVRFEEERALRRSREVDQVEQQAPQQGATPQVSGASGGTSGSGGSPSSGVTGSQSTVSPGTGSPGAGSSGTVSQSSGSPLVISEPSSSGGEAPVEDFPIPPQETTAGKRKPRWLRETLKEAQEAVGRPKWSVRESRPPERLGGFVADVVETEPTSFEEAASQQIWRDAMVEEYASIMKNDVWEVVPRPDGKSVVTSRWLYKIKHVADGSVEKFKARFVARGSHR
jgi:hypothetical protein